MSLLPEGKMNENQNFAEIKVRNLSEYLSPNWILSNEQESYPPIDYPEYLLHDDKHEQQLSIIELVATELHSYILSHIQIYLNQINLKIENHDEFLSNTRMIELIKTNAVENSNYCRKIIAWIIKSHFPPKFSKKSNIYELEREIIEYFNQLCDDYMKYSPGPWREGVLLEAIRGLISI